MFLLTPSFSKQMFAKKATSGSTVPTSTPSILVPDDIAANHSFGTRVDVSNDTMIVSSPGYDNGAGAVYVFVKSGGSWVQQARLTAADSLPSTDQFAEGAISISNDTVVISAIASSAAAVYVFVRNGTTWSQQAKITNFGGSTVGSVANLLVQNNELFVGNVSEGVYAFTRSGTTWTFRAKIDNPTLFGAGSGFGTAIVRCNDSLALGALNSDAFGTNVGLIGTWKGSGATWTSAQAISPTPYIQNQYFGQVMQASGNTMVVGSPMRTNPATPTTYFSGGAHIYVYDGTTWNAQQIVELPSYAGSDQFGSSVFVSGDRLAVGVPNRDEKGSNSGAVAVYDRTGTTWSFVSKIIPSDLVASSTFGTSVAVHGQQIIVGFPKSTYAGAAAGAVYLF